MDQHVTFLPFLLNESKDREKGISHLLIRPVPQVQLVDCNRTLEIDVELHTAHYARDLVFPQRCLILGEMNAAEPDLPEPCLSIKDLLSLAEKSWHFRIGHLLLLIKLIINQNK